MELVPDQMAKLKEAAGRMSAKMRSVRIVSASNVSRKDLEQRLIQKGEDPAHARQAVEHFEACEAKYEELYKKRKKEDRMKQIERELERLKREVQE